MPDALNLSCGPDLICFSHLRWDFVYQRPQHLLSRAACEYRVIIVEEPVLIPDTEPHLHVTDRPEGVIVVLPILPVGIGGDETVIQMRKLVCGFLRDRTAEARVLWYYTPMAVPFTRNIDADVVVYDIMDELSTFMSAPPQLRTLEDELFTRADLVFTGGRSLYAAKRDRHSSVHLFPSSIDAAHFAVARECRRAVPEDQARIPRPRVGFFGVIDERLDVDLVRKVADLRPSWHFVMIGPVVKIDPLVLPRQPNVHWLGPKAYADLPYYLESWDAGFMPFALNEATRFISPTKTPEFLAAGLPVVSTAIQDVVTPYGDWKLVEIAQGEAELVAKLEEVLSRPRTSWLAEVDRRLEPMSWDKTWSEMHDLIEAAVFAKACPPQISRGVFAGRSNAIGGTPRV